MDDGNQPWSPFPGVEANNYSSNHNTAGITVTIDGQSTFIQYVFPDGSTHASFDPSIHSGEITGPGASDIDFSNVNQNDGISYSGACNYYLPFVPNEWEGVEAKDTCIANGNVWIDWDEDIMGEPPESDTFIGGWCIGCTNSTQLTTQGGPYDMDGDGIIDTELPSYTGTVTCEVASGELGPIWGVGWASNYSDLFICQSEGGLCPCCEDGGNNDVIGCMDPLACNYNSNATIGDMTLCEYNGCTCCADELASNYGFINVFVANVGPLQTPVYNNVYVGVEHESCINLSYEEPICEYDTIIEEIYGCTDSSAENYISAATVRCPDGT